ncbi:MAG: hypothetical protein DMG36_27020 [Acidobacteria bacterium]|nr:MAG: hypothetical protein DMG36_27020 [Acidobacteriota bacterium]
MHRRRVRQGNASCSADVQPPGSCQGAGGREHSPTNAGHNAPVLTREDAVQVRLEQGGLIVGAFQESVYDQGEIDLRHGDRLVMFTDGLSEAVDGNREEFGEKRLAEASLCNRQLSAEALHRCLLDRVTDFCGRV